MQKPMRMLLSQEHIQIIPNKELCNFEKLLTIERNNFRIVSNQPISDVQQEIQIFGLVGVYNINGKFDLLYISEANLICRINNQAIYEIVSISDILQNSLNLVEQQFTSRIAGYLSKCTYFSLSYDLTIPLMQQNQPDQGERSVRYWWNFHGYKVFLTQNIPKCWCIKIIQGFVGIGQTEILTEKQQIVYILIARRETLRGGTRYNHRGVNVDGASANTVESESLVQYQDKLYCHLQIRGSVPVFWEQKGIRAISQLTQNQEQTKMALTKHLINLKKTYGSLLLVDLMASDKPNESLVSQTYSDVFNILKIQQTQHIHIDFNAYCKNYRFDYLNPIILSHRSTLNQHSFTKFQSNKLSMEQFNQLTYKTGLYIELMCFRLKQHSLSLIRCYLIQESIFKKSLSVKQFLIQYGIHLIQSDKEHAHTLIKIIKILWGESGDNISRLYAGTNSSTTKIQKTGGSSWTGILEHGIKGFHRFYNQNITDDEKQSVYEYVVGENSTPNKDFLGYVEQISQQSPIKNSNILVMAIGYDAQNQQIRDFYHLIDSRQVPQLIIIQMQNVDRSRQSSNFMRDHLIAAIRSQLGQYECAMLSQNLKQYSLIFVKQNALISKVLESIISYEGKEIAILQQFKYEEYTLQALNCNFKCQELTLFQKCILDELQKYPKPEISFISGIQESQIKIQNTVEEFGKLIKNDIIANLYLKDELCQNLQQLDLLKGYQEPVITFLPKQKSWPNRILFGSSTSFDAFNPLVYEEATENGIRMLMSVDFKLLELTGQKNEIDDDDGADISQQFYWKCEEDDDEFEVIT